MCVTAQPLHFTLGRRRKQMTKHLDISSENADKMCDTASNVETRNTNCLKPVFPILENDEQFYKSFKCPTTVSITGTTSSGKTFFLRKLLQNADYMFSPKPDKVLYCYGVWQNLYADIERELGVEFHEGIPTEETVDSFVDGSHNIIILDDLMDLVVQSNHVQNLFVRGSHHKNITIIYLNQNMFCQGKNARTINLNSHYMVAMRNPRDISQVSVLGKQIGLGKALVMAYQECMSKPYGYLVIDLSPHNHAFKLKTDIFPDQHTSVFLPS